MDAQEIANRIALLWNPMPDMSGQQINRLHGRQRRLVEDLAKEITDESAAMLAAERERCAALAEEVHLYRPYASARQSGISIAAAIRALTPKAGGGEP